MTTTRYPVWVTHYEIPDGHYYADIQELDGIVRLGPGTSTSLAGACTASRAVRSAASEEAGAVPQLVAAGHSLVSRR
jgi:hypothetical protein